MLRGKRKMLSSRHGMVVVHRYRVKILPWVKEALVQPSLVEEVLVAEGCCEEGIFILKRGLALIGCLCPSG